MTPAALSALLQGDIGNFEVASTPGGIEAQEAQGQKDFVASEALPVKCLRCTREQLEQIGIIFGAPVDDLFVNCQLPEGWKKMPTDHSMWSRLVDDKERVRASIFYKAAFYDRNAHIVLENFISLSSLYGDSPIQGKVINANKEVLYETKKTELPDKEPWQVRDKLQKECELWLKENYLNYRDPLAYWA